MFATACLVARPAATVHQNLVHYVSSTQTILAHLERFCVDNCLSYRHDQVMMMVESWMIGEGGRRDIDGKSSRSSRWTRTAGRWTQSSYQSIYQVGNCPIDHVRSDMIQIPSTMTTEISRKRRRRKEINIAKLMIESRESVLLDARAIPN